MIAIPHMLGLIPRIDCNLDPVPVHAYSLVGDKCSKDGLCFYFIASVKRFIYAHFVDTQIVYVFGASLGHVIFLLEALLDLTPHIDLCQIVFQIKSSILPSYHS